MKKGDTLHQEEIVWDSVFDTAVNVKDETEAVVKKGDTLHQEEIVWDSVFDTAVKAKDETEAVVKKGDIPESLISVLHNGHFDADEDLKNRCSAEKEMNKSMMRNMLILESEKEKLRKKLNEMAPGEIRPVFECAVETKRIGELETQVKYLQDENIALHKKNEDLGNIKLNTDSAETERIGELETQVEYLQDENIALHKKNEDLGNIKLNTDAVKDKSEIDKSSPFLEESSGKTESERELINHDENKPLHDNDYDFENAEKLDIDLL